MTTLQDEVAPPPEGVSAFLLPRLRRLGRLVAIGAASGALSGLLIGGLGSRLVMRIVAIVGGEESSGRLTDNGNTVGDITADGTIGLIIFGGILAGILGGLVYVLVRRWLPGAPPWRGLTYGVFILGVLGFLVIDDGNPDFAQFGSPGLNVAMFGVLFILYGLLIVPAAMFFERVLPPSDSQTTSISKGIYYLLPAAFILLSVAIGPPGVLVFLAVATYLLAPAWEPKFRKAFSRLPGPLAHHLRSLALLVPVLVGGSLLGLHISAIM